MQRFSSGTKTTSVWSFGWTHFFELALAGGRAAAVAARQRRFFGGVTGRAARLSTKKTKGANLLSLSLSFSLKHDKPLPIVPPHKNKIASQATKPPLCSTQTQGVSFRFSQKRKISAREAGQLVRRRQRMEFFFFFFRFLRPPGEEDARRSARARERAIFSGSTCARERFVRRSTPSLVASAILFFLPLCLSHSSPPLSLTPPPSGKETQKKHN